MAFTDTSTLRSNPSTNNTGRDKFASIADVVAITGEEEMPVRERLIDLILEMRLRLLKHDNKEAHITEYGAAPESIDTLISVTKPKRSKDIDIGGAFSTQEEYAREVAIG